MFCIKNKKGCVELSLRAGDSLTGRPISVQENFKKMLFCHWKFFNHNTEVGLCQCSQPHLLRTKFVPFLNVCQYVLMMSFFTDEISSPQNPNPLPTQAVSPASKQTSAPLTTKSVDQTMQSKQTEQQNPPKLPHTDRVVSRGPSSPPFHEEPNPLEQVKTFSKPIICEAQAGDENANSNTRSVSSESPLNIHGTNGKAHTRDEKLKANTPKICTEAPSSAQYKLSQFSQTGASNQHQTNSMDILVQQPPPNQLPVGFAPLFKTDDPAVIRSVAFHPRGHVMAIGSNSRVLKLCSVPEEVLTPLQ